MSLSPVSGSPASAFVSIKNESSPPTTVTIPSNKPTAPASGKSKPRKRVNTAEKRHQHNAIERQRRETLNGKFLSLARLLPSLAASRRPSKSAIVNGSIGHLTYQRDQRLLAARLLRRLAAEHDQLLNEVNEWRKAGGFAPRPAAQAWNDEIEEVCSVEKEVFGNFAAFDADGDDNDNDDDDTLGMSMTSASAQANDFALEQANLTAANFSNGLFTPRPSAELDVLAQSQALFGNLQMQQQTQAPAQSAAKRSASLNGLNWSHDFAFGAGNGVSSAASSLPFSAFMTVSDSASHSLDVSSSSSPANSAHGQVLTPPMTAESLVYTQTPSPASTASFSAASVDNKVNPQQITGWAPLSQQQQQPQLGFAPQQPSFAPTANIFAGIFAQQQQQQPATTTDAFTQSLLASVFPSSGVSAEQIEQWKKVALSGISSQPAQSMTGLTTSLVRDKFMWNPTAVEGF